MLYIICTFIVKKCTAYADHPGFCGRKNQNHKIKNNETIAPDFFVIL